jgi:hypothetical protein
LIPVFDIDVASAQELTAMLASVDSSVNGEIPSYAQHHCPSDCETVGTHVKTELVEPPHRCNNADDTSEKSAGMLTSGHLEESWILESALDTALEQADEYKSQMDAALVPKNINDR